MLDLLILAESCPAMQVCGCCAAHAVGRLCKRGVLCQAARAAWQSASSSELCSCWRFHAGMLPGSIPVSCCAHKRQVTCCMNTLLVEPCASAAAFAAAQTPGKGHSLCAVAERGSCSRLAGVLLGAGPGHGHRRQPSGAAAAGSCRQLTGKQPSASLESSPAASHLPLLVLPVAALVRHQSAAWLTSGS